LNRFLIQATHTMQTIREKIASLRKKLDALIYFDVNRPLKETERAARLLQNESSPIPVAWPQLSVIKMNSTFLECTNYPFGTKGFISILGFIFVPLCLFVHYVCIEEIFLSWSSLTGSEFFEMLAAMSFCFIFYLPITALSVWVLKLDCFTLTHFPMRFNRKTQMVHVFLEGKGGKIISLPWKEVFFCHSENKPGLQFTVHGHQLDKDGETVLNTFELATRDAWDSEARYLQWEFVRQYMEGSEDNLRKLADMVEEPQNVSERRENLHECFRRAWAFWAKQSTIAFILGMPFIIVSTLSRWIAVRTCKIPRWPAEIEATCQFPPDDPIIRDEKRIAPYGVNRPDLSAYTGM
jgi:hypothetical protein